MGGGFINRLRGGGNTPSNSSSAVARTSFWTVKVLVLGLLLGVTALFGLAIWQWSSRKNNESVASSAVGGGGGGNSSTGDDMDGTNGFDYNLYSKQILSNIQSEFTNQLQALHALSIFVSSTAVSPSALT